MSYYSKRFGVVVAVIGYRTIYGHPYVDLETETGSYILIPRRLLGK